MAQQPPHQRWPAGPHGRSQNPRSSPPHLVTNKSSLRHDGKKPGEPAGLFYLYAVMSNPHSAGRQKRGLTRRRMLLSGFQVIHGTWRPRPPEPTARQAKQSKQLRPLKSHRNVMARTRNDSFLHRHSLSLVSSLILLCWIVLYSRFDPDTHWGAFFGNAIAD